MFITIASPSYPPSLWNSIGRTTYSIAHGLAALGHKITVIAYNPAIGEKFAKDRNVRIQYLGTDGKSTLAIDKIGEWQATVSAFLTTYCRNTERFICIDSYCYKAIKDSGLTAPVLGLCDFLYGSTGWLDKIGKVYEESLLSQEKEFIQGSDILLCNNKITQQRIANLYDKIASLYTISIPEIKGYTYAPKKNQVLYVGKLNREKGLERVLRVMPKLEWLHLVLCDQNANNSYKMIIGKLASELGIGHRVEYTGFLNTQAVWKLYTESEICVVPHIAEPFGYSALYPMMLGIPIIVSTANGLPEIVGTDGDAGAVFRNIDDLAFYLEEVHYTDSLKAMYSKNGREKVLTERSMSAMIDSIAQHL